MDQTGIGAKESNFTCGKSLLKQPAGHCDAYLPGYPIFSEDI